MVSGRKSSGRFRIADAARRLVGFGPLHVTNTALNAAYSLVLLIVLSRLLPSGRYSEVVFLTAVGLYVQPIDQALARSNFISLRETHLGSGSSSRAASTALAAQSLLLAAIALVVPLAISHGELALYVENVLYLGFAIAFTHWSFSIQSTGWALDKRYAIVCIGLTHRVLQFAVLGVLWYTKSFLVFSALAFGVIVAALLLGWRTLAKAEPGKTALQSPTLRLPRKDVAHHFWLFVTSLMSTISELALFNSPYALFTALFGVGVAVVAFDTIMKIGRLILMGARTLAELALARQTRLMAAGDRRRALYLYLLIFGLCIAGAAVPSLGVLFEGPRIFSLLLGPNNVIPAAASTPAAVVLIALGIYQPAMFLLGYSKSHTEVRVFTGTTIVGLVVFVGVVAGLRLPIVGALWAYAAYLLAQSLIASALALRLLAQVAPGPGAMAEAPAAV